MIQQVCSLVFTQRSWKLISTQKPAHRSYCCGSVETNLTSIHEDTGSILGLSRKVKDLALLWLWCRPVATAPIQPLAWEPPYAMGATLERQKQTNKHRKTLHINVYSSFILNCPNLEATTMSFSGWMDKYTVVHPDNGLLFRANRKWTFKQMKRHGNLNAHN